MHFNPKNRTGRCPISRWVFWLKTSMARAITTIINTFKIKTIIQQYVMGFKSQLNHKDKGDLGPTLSNPFKDKGDLGPTLSKSRPKRRRHYSCTYIAISAQAVQAKILPLVESTRLLSRQVRPFCSLGVFMVPAFSWRKPTQTWNGMMTYWAICVRCRQL